MKKARLALAMLAVVGPLCACSSGSLTDSTDARRAILAQEMRTLHRETAGLQKQGVVFVEYGRDGLTIEIGLARDTAPDSDELLRSTIGSVGVVIKHNLRDAYFF